MKQILITVTEEGAGLRLDKFLSENHEDLSRSFVQNLIDDECVLVNGKIAIKPNYKSKLNDEIEVNLPEIKELEAFAQDLDLNIVYEDSDVIVINKDKGMIVHPGAGNPDGTIVNGLLHCCTDLSGINGVLRPGIVHRIDKDTTGLLVACKNDKSHELLSAQLSNKTCSRKYIALVHNNLPHEYGTIDAPIGRHKGDRQKMCVTAKNSRSAVTHFKVLKHYEKFTLVECSLETGRTHQIRVHMQYIKYPIVGDQKYSMRKTLATTNGQMLHAFELSFIHPSTNEKMTLNADLPQYFKDILEILDNGGDIYEYQQQ